MTVTHKLGQTTIPAQPRRVVTVGQTDQDAVLALGVVPVGTTEWYGDYPGALWPWAQEKRNELNGALPTVTQPEGVVDFGIPWHVQTRVVGQALGRSSQAEQLIASVEQQIVDAKAAHPEFAGKTALTVGWFSDQWYAYSSNDQRGRILSELGFTVPAEINQLAGDEFGSFISLERSDLLLDSDALVWVTFADGQAEAIRNSPGYATSKAATADRDVFIPSDAKTKLVPMAGFITVLSLPLLLEALPAQLSALIDGNPATAPPAPEPLPAA